VAYRVEDGGILGPDDGWHCIIRESCHTSYSSPSVNETLRNRYFLIQTKCHHEAKSILPGPWPSHLASNFRIQV